MMAQSTQGIPVPGCIGFYIIGDKTYEFFQSPIEFTKKYVKQHKSSMFKVRVLNQATIFITSNEAVRELLKDKAHKFDMGYKDFGYMYSIYGELLLFFNNEDVVSRLRGIVHSVFSSETVTQFIEITHQTCDRRLQDFIQDEPIVIYDHFKRIATEMCLSMFLGLDFITSEKEAAHIVELTITHWHGLISFPVFLKIRGYASSYALAIDAQNRLLDVIKQRLPESSDCFSLLGKMKNAGFRDIEELSRHMLLFVSALVPKALSSLLTSCCLELGKPHNASRRKRAQNDDEYLDKVLLEISRLWPPFVGGRRLAKQDVVLQGFQIPKDYAVAYLTRNANLDPDVFKNPEEFLPERWEGSDAPDKSRVYTFGYGPRNCVGDHCIEQIIHEMMKRVLEKYDWCLEDDQDLTYKWLPVSRPMNNVHARFTLRTPQVPE